MESSAVDHATPSAPAKADQSHWAASAATTAPPDPARNANGHSTGSNRQTATSARPKSAAALSRKLLLTTSSISSSQREDTTTSNIHNNSNNSVRARTQQHGASASPSVRVPKATFNSSRVEMDHEDQFCTKFKSPRSLLHGPRPPSASSALVSSSINSSVMRPNRFRDTDAHNGDESRPMSGSSSRDVRVGVISQRVMKEEIETQRRVTRQVQRQFHALQHTLAEKLKELELVRRHLSSFEAQMSLMTASPTQLSGSTTVVNSSPTVVVLTAGAQSGGSGARHRESIAAAAGLSESPAAPVSIATRLKDQVQRQELYKKKLKQLLERLSRHVQFLQANLEGLRIKQASTKRELQFFQAKLLQERNHYTELEHKRHELVEAQATLAHNAMLVLNSLREEIASRSMMSRSRYEADRRREELLTLVHSSPATRSGSSRTASADRGALTSSLSLKNSLHVLSVDKSSSDFAPSFFFSTDHGCKSPNTTVATAMPSGFLHRSNSVDLQQFLHREVFMQIYEGQYAHVLEETGESDLSVVIERFVSFKETKRHLLQIESDVSEQNAQLEREREAHNDLVRKLRVSGIAEVEKRKKIRDFLEQMHHVKAQVKGQARDKFVEQLKTFSYVQQGVSNIMELFKCLDDKPQASSPPSSSALTFPLAAGGSPAIVAHLLEEMVHFCVHVARSNPSETPTVFTTEQVDKLRMFVSDHLKPDFRKRQSRLLNSIESSFGARKSPASSPVKTESLAAQGVLSTLLKAKRRRSSMEDAVGRKPSLSQSPVVHKSGERGHAISKTSSEVRAPRAGRKYSGAQQLGSCRTNDDGRADAEVTDDDESLVSSESDSEDVRRDIKRGEKDTLQQVEVLLRTFDAKQSMSSSNSVDHQSTAAKLKHRRSVGRHDSLHLVTVSEGGGGNLGLLATVSDTRQQSTGETTAIDKSARLEAVHAFFREKRRRERQEQQQQREVLALLAEAAYSTKIVSNSSSHMDPTGGTGTRGQATGANSSTGGGSGSKISGPVRSKVVTSMMPRKRSNGVAALALNSVIQQQQVHAQSSAISQSSSASQHDQQQQQQQARGSAPIPRKPIRPPKTAR